MSSGRKLASASIELAFLQIMASKVGWFTIAAAYLFPFGLASYISYQHSSLDVLWIGLLPICLLALQNIRQRSKDTAVVALGASLLVGFNLLENFCQHVDFAHSFFRAKLAEVTDSETTLAKQISKRPK